MTKVPLCPPLSGCAPCAPWTAHPPPPSRCWSVRAPGGLAPGPGATCSPARPTAAWPCPTINTPSCHQNGAFVTVDMPILIDTPSSPRVHNLHYGSPLVLYIPQVLTSPAGSLPLILQAQLNVTSAKPSPAPPGFGRCVCTAVCVSPDSCNYHTVLSHVRVHIWS